MKPANNAPVYAAMYADLAEVCRRHGYALAIHGSLARDFDIVAIPWVATPSRPQAVVDEIVKMFAVQQVDGDPRTHEHGRICYSLPVCWGETCLDFSFMPTIAGSP